MRLYSLAIVSTGLLLVGAGCSPVIIPVTTPTSTIPVTTSTVCAALHESPSTQTPNCCAGLEPITVAGTRVCESNDPLIITYSLLKKSASNTTYCDGATMDSVAYKAALTQSVSESVSGTYTLEEKIRKTLELAATAASFNPAYTRSASTTFANGVVTMHSANGWAGSSIFYCAWKPFVEKNVMQYSEVTSIIWNTEN